MMRKSLLAAALLVSSSSVFAATPPCVNEVTVVNNPSSFTIPGVRVGEEILNVDVGMSMTQSDLKVTSATNTDKVNPGNTYDEETSTVKLDCVSYRAETFTVGLGVVPTEEEVGLSVDGIGKVFNLNYYDYEIFYSPDNGSNRPNERMSIKPNGEVFFPDRAFLVNAGKFEKTNSDTKIDFSFAEFNIAEFRSGNFSGNYRDGDEEGSYVAYPIVLGKSLDLNKGRFNVNVIFEDAEGNTRDGQAIQLTGDSGSFYSSDQDIIDLIVRVLNGCKENSHYWVFAEAFTDVTYELQITDTQTNETKTYPNPLGAAAPAITDTAAFATCP